MSISDGADGGGSGPRRVSAASVIIVSSVMFTFISFWRTAAVVLCDLASTAYYIGGIVEQSIGPAAPWFILAVMLFSYAVRSVYIESSSLFVRGGVYRVVKEAMGGPLAKLSVSALMFDYVLTGPISAVSAGQYIMGLAIETAAYSLGLRLDDATRDAIKAWGSVAIAVAITVYFFRQNVLGIHESSDKAMKIMVAMTVMGIVMLAWCGVTLLLDGPHNPAPWQPDFSAKIDPNTNETTQPLGFLAHSDLESSLVNLHGRPARDWLSIVGLIGICIAFGHSILAMSGEETLAQVYREVESPKLKNFKRAAFVVFVYSLLLTGAISFFAVLLIPNDVRMSRYADNLIGGLAMNVAGPLSARLLLNGFVVVVGFLALAGAVNTAIIGSNGVLNRVAEDGVVPGWFLKPHPRYGTTYRMLAMILVLQLGTILLSRGDVLVLGEAYAFGVVWSFVFKSAAMLVLRFKDATPREFKVPLNPRFGRIEIPVGLGLIFLVLFAAAIANLLTKTVATTAGLGFTAIFLTAFTVTERYNRRRHHGKHEHLEQFNRRVAPEITSETLGLSKAYRKLVAIRSPGSMYMLEKALDETDPETTDVIVMTAKIVPADGHRMPDLDLDTYDQQLMTQVVNRAEHAGKHVQPLIVPTNNALHAVLQTVKSLQIQEVLLGASNKYTAEEQLDQVALYWISMHQGAPAPLTIRILSRYWDVYLDLGGGNRIPKISERRARSVAELRAAGVGVNRLLLAHDGSPASHDVFQLVLTMLDPQVALDIVGIPSYEGFASEGQDFVRQQDLERAKSLGRELDYCAVEGEWGRQIVQLAEQGKYDLIILCLPLQAPDGATTPWDEQTDHVLKCAQCHVFLAAQQSIPTIVAE